MLPRAARDQPGLAAIGYMHRERGFDPPQARVGAQAIRDVLAGIRRTHGTRKERKSAADAGLLRDILHAITGDEPRAATANAVASDLIESAMTTLVRRSEKWPMFDLLTSVPGVGALLACAGARSQASSGSLP